MTTFALRVEGSAFGFEGQYIRLYQISDFISSRERKLDVIKVSEDGSFQLNGHMIHSGLIKIRIEDKTLDLLVFPDLTLKILLSYDEEKNKDRLYDKSLEVEILENSDRGINVLIFEYQKKQAEFLEVNHAALVTKKMIPLVKEFSEKMKIEYGSAPKFFKTYLEYDLAALEDAVLGSEKKLFAFHLENKPVLYGNMAYMNFFEQFYQERFIQISQGKNGFELLSAVNGSQNYAKMMELVKEHPYAGNDTTAQLFAILGLKEVYGDETFKKEKVLNMLNILSDKALNFEHQLICKNIIHELTFLKKGKPAPVFSLKDEGQEVHHLGEFKEKPVLLFFWSANSRTCLRDFEFVQEYAKKYGDKLQILAINMDQNTSKAEKIIMKEGYQVLTLFKDNQYDLIDKYRLYSTPTYALLDEKHHIVAYPAPRPEENLEGEIYRLISEN